MTEGIGSKICRWCGDALNEGFKHCRTCHKHQGWLKETIGKTSNLIAVVSVFITLSQLLLAMEQNSNASQASDEAQNAYAATQEALSMIKILEGNIKGTLIQVEDSAIKANTAYLKAVALEEKQKKTTNTAEVDAITIELDKMTESYQEKLKELQNITPTITIETPQVEVRSNCTGFPLGFQSCVPVPVIKMVNVTTDNPIYNSIKMDLDVLSKIIENRKTELSRALNAKDTK